MEKILVLVLSLLLVFSLGVCMKDYATKEDLEEQIEISFDWLEEELKDISKQCSGLEKEKSVNYIDNRIDYDNVDWFTVDINVYNSGTQYIISIWYFNGDVENYYYENLHNLLSTYELLTKE